MATVWAAREDAFTWKNDPTKTVPPDRTAASPRFVLQSMSPHSSAAALPYFRCLYSNATASFHFAKFCLSRLGK
jgi:hypothetical protein